MTRKNTAAKIPQETRRDSAEVWEVVRTLVLGNADHNRLLELYYWSLEPELLETVRAFLALPPKAQTALTSYLMQAQSQNISAQLDAHGRLIMSSGNTASA